MLRLKVLDGLASALAKGDDNAAEIASLRSGPQGETAHVGEQGDAAAAEDQFVLAKVYVIKGDADSALQAYDQATRLDPNNFAVAKEAGLFYEKANQTDKAKSSLITAYQIAHRKHDPDDEQVVAALRRIGVVPGPALLESRDLAEPIVPRGPLPEVDLAKVRVRNPFVSTPAETPDPAAAAAPKPGAGPKD